MRRCLVFIAIVTANFIGLDALAGEHSAVGNTDASVQTGVASPRSTTSLPFVAASQTPIPSPEPVPSSIPTDESVTDITERLFKEYLQATHQLASFQVLNLANDVDSIFGNRLATDDVNRTTLRISRTDQWNESSPSAGAVNIDLDLKLPVLERKQNDVLDRIRRTGEEQITRAVEFGAETPESADEERAALERLKREWNFHVEPGVSVGREIGYRIRGRISKSFATGEFAHHFSEELTWSNTDLWSLRTLFNSDYAVAEHLLFRFINEANDAISAEKFTSTHGPSLIYQIDDNSVGSFDIRASSSIEQGSYGVRSYTTSVTYHRNLLDKWLRFNITPGFSFPRDNDFRKGWFVAVTLEAVFGRI